MPDPTAARPAVAQVAEVAKGGGVDGCIPATAPAAVRSTSQ